MPRSRKQDTVYESEMEEVLNWVISLRERYNLTQNEFAKRVGVSTTYINMLNQHKRKPSLQVLKRIADAFHDSSTLQEILPRAYEDYFEPVHQGGNNNETMQLSSPISLLFQNIDQQASFSTETLIVEQMSDQGLESWGVPAFSFCLSEKIETVDLTTGDLVTYGEDTIRKWGFIIAVGGGLNLISSGEHLREVLRLSEVEWARSGFSHLIVERYELKSEFSALNIRKVNLIINRPPHLRTPINSHPSYKSLKPADRHVIDETIVRFNVYAKGESAYQPSQHPQ